MSVGHGADPGFLAVNQQVTLVINSVVASVTFHKARGYFLRQRESFSPIC